MCPPGTSDGGEPAKSENALAGILLNSRDVLGEPQTVERKPQFQLS